MMKRIFYAASLVALMGATVANAQETTDVVVGFENQVLNEQGFWCGDTNGTAKDNGYGGTTYACVYEEGAAQFNTSYSVSYWSGFAVSSRTETDFQQGAYLTPDDTPDQFNNIAGKAYDGSNFCVITTYGETVDFTAPAQLKGFWFVNSAYTAEVIKNGNAYAHKFEATDWLTCTVTGTQADGTTKTVDIKLAENGDYVKEWQFADLSALGTVSSLSFSFSGSDSGDWGVNTPAYICIDNLTYAPAATAVSAAKVAASAVVARYDLNGRQLSAPQKGLNIVRMADGTVRKVVVK